MTIFFFQAHDVRSNEVVAIKKMSFSGKQSNEVRIKYRLNHCSTVPDCLKLTNHVLLGVLVPRNGRTS